jgi:UrcA family protein
MRAKTTLLLSSILAVASLNTVALADPSVNVKSETVRYGDLRLISAVGASVLYARLRSAAERVCGGLTPGAPIAEQRRFKSCVDESLAKAVTDVNHPVLNQYAALRRGTTTEPDKNLASVSVTAKAE